MQITEAVYSQGVLKPLGRIELADQQRVRITIEPINGHTPIQATERAAAFARLREIAIEMKFRLRGPLPSRDELHEHG